MGSKMFWSTVIPFFSSKRLIHNDNISIEVGNEIIADEYPTNLETVPSTVSKKEIVAIIIDKFKNHPSIISMTNELPPTTELNTKAATVDQINKIIRRLDAKKAAGPGKILVKVVKMSKYIIDKQITKTINNNLLENSSSGFTKIASVSQYLKMETEQKQKNTDQLVL